MRLLSLAAVAAALAFSAPASAQRADGPSLRSTFVVPSHPGEAFRVTTYARRPPEQGRLAGRYRGLRANRSARTETLLVRPRPVARTYSTPRKTFVLRDGTFFHVLLAR